MKALVKSIAWTGICIMMVSLCSFVNYDKGTTVYIVRHAEKDVSDPNNNNPDLSAEGKARAIALNDFLKKEKISAAFSTNYRRTMQTAAPVAQKHGIPVKTYDPKDPEALAALVKTEFLNKKVLITGHSNTVLELVKAFGEHPPVDKLNDDDYDLIFIVTLQENGETRLKIKRYGKSHHSTEIAKESMTH